MSTEDFKKLPVGRYEIEGDDIFALVQDQTTGLVSEKKAESHGNYIDIQFLMSGEEMQGYAPLTASAVGKQVEGKDNIFYDVLENEQFVHLKAGDFTIYFTNDIHRDKIPPMSAKEDRFQKMTTTPVPKLITQWRYRRSSVCW